MDIKNKIDKHSELDAVISDCSSLVSSYAEILSQIDINCYLMISSMDDNYVLNNDSIVHAKNIEQEAIAAMSIVRETKLVMKKIEILNTRF